MLLKRKRKNRIKKGYKKLDCGRCLNTVIVPDIPRYRCYCEKCLTSIHKYGRSLKGF